jgi:hypothetical protein
MEGADPKQGAGARPSRGSRQGPAEMWRRAQPGMAEVLAQPGEALRPRRGREEARQARMESGGDEAHPG